MALSLFVLLAVGVGVIVGTVVYWMGYQDGQEDADSEALHADGGIVPVCEGHYAEGVVRGHLIPDPDREVAS